MIFDCSNYSSTLTSTALADTELVLIQALDPPAGYPKGETRTQLQACQDASVPADIYFFLFAGQSDATILHHLSLANGFAIRKKWLDIEEPGLSIKYIAHVLALMDGYLALYPPTGIYAARWWAQQNPGVLDSFHNRQLWCAQYDGVADAGVFTAFSGWSDCRIKQYQGTSTWNGISGVDLNVLSAAELADLNPTPITPIGDHMIHVGQGMQDQMNANNDAPLADHLNYTQTDDDGIVYQVEKCIGKFGQYVSSTSSGTWVNAGPF